MKRSKFQGEPEATLNLTPTIDVVFLLLIFFIATIRLPKPEANIRAFLPKKEKADAAAAARAETEETESIDRVHISLRSAAGRTELKLNGAPVKNFRHLDASLAALRRIAAMAKGVETEVILGAGREVPYRYVVNTLDVCAKHKFTNVSFAMPPKGTAGPP